MEHNCDFSAIGVLILPFIAPEIQKFRVKNRSLLRIFEKTGSDFTNFGEARLKFWQKSSKKRDFLSFLRPQKRGTIQIQYNTTQSNTQHNPSDPAYQAKRRIAHEHEAVD
jgi:hypothetical protein